MSLQSRRKTVKDNGRSSSKIKRNLKFLGAILVLLVIIALVMDITASPSHAEIIYSAVSSVSGDEDNSTGFFVILAFVICLAIWGGSKKRRRGR